MDLLVYCHRPETQGRLATPPLWGYNYLLADDIANWASAAAPRIGIQAPRSDARADPGPSNAGGEHDPRDDYPLFLPGLSSSPSNVPDAGEGYNASSGAPRTGIADRSKIRALSIAMGMQTQSETNTARSELSGRGHDSQDEKVQKCGTQSDAEDLEQLVAMKARHAADALKWYKAKAILKCRAQDDD